MGLLARRGRGLVATALVLALVVVAMACGLPSNGITHVGMDAGGTLLAGELYLQGGWYIYWSEDGGKNWTPDTSSERTGLLWDEKSVETPNGRYEIRDPEIVLVDADGNESVVYSADYLRQAGNVWVQRQVTPQGDGVSGVGRPHSITYDANSGNVIVAMGLRGVVVLTPDRQWTKYAVGEYTPLDYSFSAKTNLLFSDFGFWITSLVLSLSMAAMGLIISRFKERQTWMILAAPLIAVAVLIAAAVVVPPIVLLFLLRFLIDESILIAAFLILITVASIGGGVAIGFLPLESDRRMLFALTLGALALALAGFSLYTFGGTKGYIDGDAIITVVAVPMLGFCVGAIAVSWRQLRQFWLPTIATIVAMNVIFVLFAILWLHGGLLLEAAKILVIIPVVLLAFTLSNYVSGKTPYAAGRWRNRR